MSMSSESKIKFEAIMEQMREAAEICVKQCPPKETYECWCGSIYRSDGGFDRHLEMHVRHQDYDIPDLVSGTSLFHPWSFQNTKKLAFKRDIGICRSCKSELNGTYEVHHIRPRSRGGSDHPANLILLCLKCHNITKKGHRFGGTPFTNTKKLDTY